MLQRSSQWQDFHYKNQFKIKKEGNQNGANLNPFDA